MALHGRDADLALLDETLASSRTGRGRALFFTGEAGIGKSTLLREARVRAPRDAAVLAGAAWESGGAPPYWPWQQVLRDAIDQFGDRVRALPTAEHITALVPEWSGGTHASDAPDPAAARFALLDAVARTLVALAAERPLVILLDDLHAADLPTLDLFVHLVRELPRAAIALVAAWREGELAVREEAAQRLGRASRHANVQPLRRLTAAEVERWVGADTAAAIHGTSEGNPLFIEELLRARRGGMGSRGIDSVLAEHLGLLKAPTRELLAAASVLGRELDPTLMPAICESSDDAIAAALREAASIGIVEKRDNAWAFRHVLLRDHLYDNLAPSRRAGLHRRVGEALEHVDPARAAHHLLQSGEDVERAVAVARNAAARATAIYAFEDAAALLAAALRSVTDPTAVPAIDLRIELAEALHRVGAGDRARAECVRAADLARAVDDSQRLARAALVYATELLTGRRDPTMNGLLEQAAQSLPPGDSALRARVLARLGAALIPSNDDATTQRAQQLARDAVAMARRLGDDETTMYALRFSGHAHSFQIGIHEGLEIGLEAIALSDQLGRPLELLDHRSFVFNAYLALGNRAAADAAADSLTALLDKLPQPHYRWRLAILRASRAVLRGQFEEAERQYAAASELAGEYDLDRARMAITFGRLCLVAASRSPARAEAIIDEVRARIDVLQAYTQGILAFVLAAAGRRDEARGLLGGHTFIPALVITQFSAEAVLLVGDATLAEQVLPVLIEQEKLYPMLVAHAASIVARPAASLIGELHLLCGRVDEAIAYCERGLALARAIESPPFIAICEEALAKARGPTTATAPPDLTLSSDRESTRIRWRGRELVAPASKGMAYLATLIAAPCREIHVSDLIGDDDRGDAGDVLDARARASYKQRAEELRGQLEEAHARNDLGRIERLTTELDAITDELLAGTGLGGRARKAGSRVERARVNVQRRIKDAIRRLASEDEALGRYLEATIRTGTFCMFQPI